MTAAVYTPTADITMVRCPVHGELVAINLFRELLGRCSGCAGEAARALQTLKEDEAA